MFARIWSLSIKEFRHLRSDWWLPLFMLLGGALELLLVGWATSRPITNLPLIILDLDRSEASRNFIRALENSGTFAAPSYATRMEQVETAMDRGDVNAALIVPPGFARNLADDQAATTVPVVLNGAESVPATAALRAIEGVTREIGDRITLDRLGLADGSLETFNPSLRVWFNESLSEAYYTTPAELALMLEFTVLLFAALSFSRERELGTLEQLLVMPFTSLEIIVGKSIPVILVGMIDFTLMLGMVHLFFRVPVRGSLLLLFVLAFGYLMVELGKGMVISVVSRTQHQAFMLVMLVGMTDFMFTGYAAPVESMPRILQALANLIPAHHWLVIVRGILLKGSTLDVLWPSIAWLAALGVVIGTFSMRFVRRALD